MRPSMWGGGLNLPISHFIFSQSPCSQMGAPAYFHNFPAPASILDLNLPLHFWTISHISHFFPQSPVSQIPHRGHPGWRPFWKNFGQNRVDIARARAFIFVTRPFRIRFHLFLGYLFTTTYLKKVLFCCQKNQKWKFYIVSKKWFFLNFLFLKILKK